MHALEAILLSPLVPGLLLAIIMIVAWRRLPSLLRWVGSALLLVCYLLWTPVGAVALKHLVEHAPKAICAAPLPRAVVILAGGAAIDAQPGDYAALSRESLRRTLGGVALWRRQPAGTRLLLSGGPAPQHSLAESQLMAGLAESMGVPVALIRSETRSQTTWQNAQYLAAMQPPAPRRVWLVTSALHMPRALYAMRAAGFQPCAAPVSDYYRLAPSWAVVLPQASAIEYSDAALHELAGLAWYHVKAAHAAD